MKRKNLVSPQRRRMKVNLFDHFYYHPNLVKFFLYGNVEMHHMETRYRQLKIPLESILSRVINSKRKFNIFGNINVLLV